MAYVYLLVANSNKTDIVQSWWLKTINLFTSLH